MRLYCFYSHLFFAHFVGREINGVSNIQLDVNDGSWFSEGNPRQHSPNNPLSLFSAFPYALNYVQIITVLPKSPKPQSTDYNSIRLVLLGLSDLID